MVDPIKLGLTAALILLPACGPPPTPPPTAAEIAQRETTEAKAKAALAPYMGRTLWTVAFANYLVCADKSMLLSARCSIERGRLTFDSFEGLAYPAGVYVHVTFANGPAGITRLDPEMLRMEVAANDPARDPFAYPSWVIAPRTKKDAALAAERKKLPGAALGMWAKDVLASAWGKPDREVEHDTRRSVRTWWYYADGDVLYFEDERLAAIRRER